MRENIVGLLLIVAMGVPQFLAAQSNYWPRELTLPKTAPVEDDSIADSVSMVLTNDISLYQSFQTRNRLRYERLYSWGNFAQRADYYLRQFGDNSRNQFVDLSGSVLRHDLLADGVTIGFDWTPVLSLSQRQDGGELRSSMDVGPVLASSMAGIPYQLRAGLFGYGYNKNIVSLQSTKFDDYHGDPGIYSAFEAGDSTRPVSSTLPLYGSMRGIGRLVQGNGIGLFIGSVLYANELPLFGGSDSIFVQVGDSIANATGLSIGDYEISSFDAITASPLTHSLSGTVGFSAQERFGLTPALLYRYDLHTVSYTSALASRNDVKRTANTVTMQMNTRQDLVLIYSGGLSLCREVEDWLYKETFGAYPTDTTLSTLASFKKNLSDHMSTIVQSDHELQLTLPKGFSVAWQLHALKDANAYTFSFHPKIFSSDSLIHNINESDRRKITNHLAVGYEYPFRFKIELYGEYSRLNQYYYRSERSGESKSADEYRLGGVTQFDLQRLHVEEVVYVDVESEDFLFKEIHRDPFNPPWYSRTLSSSCRAVYRLVPDRLHLAGKLVNTFSDNGQWYGRAYLPEDVAAVRADYYAVDRKSNDYWIELFAEFRGANTVLTFGNSLRDVFSRKFNTKTQTYDIQNNGSGYTIEPYVKLQRSGERMQVDLMIKRIFETLKADRWDLIRYWDLRLQMRTEW